MKPRDPAPLLVLVAALTFVLIIVLIAPCEAAQDNTHPSIVQTEDFHHD